ncbi:MAG: cache domain-containing protein, partial [Clostridia bacterium]|nr:cache domain-containing protein [Clostridia bacterium]
MLKDIINTNSYLSEVYIYYKNIDLITSSRYMYTKELFFERTYSDSDISYEDWSSTFEKNSYASWNIISHSDENKRTMELYYQIPAFFDKFDAMAVLLIDTDEFFEHAKTAMDIYSDIGLFIVSKDNEVIMSNGVIDSIPENQNDSIVISTVSDTIGWRYVSVIPSNVFDQKLAYFKLANILNVIICLVLSGVLSFIFAKMNVRPFSKLKRIYNNEDDNDMTLINDVLNDYRSAKQTQAELERTNLMGELISTGRPGILDELKKNNIDFSEQYFCVILFKLVNVSKLFEDENDVSSVKKYDAVKLIIKNVLEEIINEKYSSYICKFNGQIVAVVNINHDYILDFNSDIEEMLKRGKEFISNNFAFSFTPFIGGIHDVKTLHKSYSEAFNALQYRTFIPTSDIVFCEDINAENKSSEESAVIPEEKKKQLISILQLGDEETSLSMVKLLMQSAPHKSPTKYRIFLFDLISTLIRAFESADNDD